MTQALLWAAAGTGFTFLMTALGASLVFLLRRRSNPLLQRIFLGFAAGVMIAASVWSLLIPAIEEAEAAGGVGWLPAEGGFVLGILLMLGLDGLLPHLHSGAAQAEGLPSSFRRTTLLVLAITLHNIPEGMAVGLTFARAAQHNGDAGLIAAAGALASAYRISPRGQRSRSRSGRRGCRADARSRTARSPGSWSPYSACWSCSRRRS